MTVTDVGRAPLRLYLSSRALALTGGSVAEAVIPLVVVLTLGGGTTAVGAVTAITLVVSLATRIPISAWVDTRPHQIRLQAYSQLTAAATAAVIPVLWWTGGLSIVTLLVAVVLVVLAKTLVSACGHGTVNQLVPVADRVRAIGTLNSLSSAADIVGQTGGPALLKLLPAPLILLADSAMNATSAILVRRLARFETTPPLHSADTDLDADGPPQSSLIQIARQVISSGPVQLLWLSGIAGSVIAPVTLVYLIRTLGVDAALVGVLYAFGAVGGIGGGLLAHRVLTRLQMWPLIAVSSLLSAGAAGSLLAASHLPYLVYPLVIVFELLSAFAGTLLVAAVYGTLQTRTGHTQIARVMSIASTGMEGLALLGIGAGTLIAARWSEHAAIMTATIGYLAISLMALTAVFGTRIDPETP
ncbi:MFS transporter [Nocardia sp. NPDC088792]|uniref:MFS transporter n=1 Tax=Nocardia sp. NPDC088792 TaxID=3364332 RepID=UPI0037FE8FB3